MIRKFLARAAAQEAQARLFDRLTDLATRPAPGARSTSAALWTDPHVAGRMLDLHLDDSVDLASRNPAFVERSAAWIAATFGLGPGRAVLDLGCGPGLYTTEFARTGAAVTGVDFSATAIDHARTEARRRRLAIDYHLADYLDFTPDRTYDLVTLIFFDFCPLDRAQRGCLLDMVRGALGDGGVFLLDLLSPRHLDRVTEARTYEYHDGPDFWSARPHHVFTHTFAYPDQGLHLDRYDIFEADRARTIMNWLQCFDPADLARELAEHGLQVAATYGDVAGVAYDPQAPDFAVAVRRAGM
ncbi:MAG: class I SAM-dependent methyltransferase [Hyphomicrobiales bacterium]|nr:class I SAM-dependent methyltransferase [Hyphomicrobiales bacterium]